MLNLVAGFMRPTTGSVLFDGQVVTEPGPERGVVFQDPTLFPWLTVQPNQSESRPGGLLSVAVRHAGHDQTGDACRKLSGDEERKDSVGFEGRIEPFRMVSIKNKKSRPNTKK